MKPSARDTPWVCLLACLLLAGCNPDEWQAITPAAWDSAEKRCAPNGGVQYVSADHLRSGGFRVRVICKNDMRSEFFSSAEAR